MFISNSSMDLYRARLCRFIFSHFRIARKYQMKREEIRNMWLPSNWNRCTFLWKYVQTHRRRAEPNSRVLLSLSYVRGAGSVLQTIFNLRKKWESMSEKNWISLHTSSSHTADSCFNKLHACKKLWLLINCVSSLQTHTRFKSVAQNSIH